MSEREKNELVQLVDTMVAYSVTYKNTKFEPQERANGSIVPMDIPSLSFDPPINDIISFKVLPNLYFYFYFHSSLFSHCA
jgi:chromosome transmission fidelity protein 18